MQDSACLSVCCAGTIELRPETERERLHLFQPPRADQMPDPHQGQGQPKADEVSVAVQLKVARVVGSETGITNKCDYD